MEQPSRNKMETSSMHRLFLLFGLFGSDRFISVQAADNAQAAETGASYLKIW